jgi:tRNA-specific 2-thiouridylase
MRVSDWNWIGEEQRQLTVKVRSLAPPVAAMRDGDWVHFAKPEYGVAPGQAAVAYDGTRLLGGGWIAETALTSTAPDAAAA